MMGLCEGCTRGPQECCARPLAAGSALALALVITLLALMAAASLAVAVLGGNV